MNSTSGFEQSTRPSLWNWIVRNMGLENWFQRPLTTDHAGQQERLFLLLAIPDGISNPTELLAETLHKYQSLIKAGGGEIVSQKYGRWLLSWPIAIGCQQARAIDVYFKLCNYLPSRAGHASLGLCGAASLGWVTTVSANNYRGPVLKEVAGLLQVSQCQSSGLLVSAALHHQLDAVPTLQYELDIATKVAGHRYPATLYRVIAKPAI
jgi:hypothetical protein